MTEQRREVLQYLGKKHHLKGEPLEDWFFQSGSRPDFVWSSTALRRAYHGSWEILDDRLYLTGVEADLPDGSRATLETMFPGFPERVFAHWYSGLLRINEGELLNSIYPTLHYRHEREFLLVVERGVLVATQDRRNAIAGQKAFLR